MLALAPIRGPWPIWVGAGAALVVLVVLGVFLFSIALRKFLGPASAEKTDEFAPPQPSSENEAAFMTASMQAVIRRLHEQEKELERLHRLEKERAEQTERLSEAVTRDMPSGLLLVNANGLITLANPAAHALLAAGALPYRRYRQALGEDSPLTRLLARCLEDGHTYQREELEHRTPAGEARQLGVTISPIYSGQAAAAKPAKARPTGALCLLSDLTELTALQRRIRLQESMAALGEMSAGIAHEFKNSLAVISGYAQLIGKELPSGELAESADRIIKETRALTHVVTEFLRFARPFELTPEVVRLGPLVEQVVAEVGEAIPQVILTTEGDFAEVSGDQGLLRQGLLNLARNAAEAASDQSQRGRVTIRGAVEEITGQQRQRISVLDNGPGIPPENLQKLFLPFFTTKPNGTGLGLAVVQKIALQHGGSVEARNLPEGGAEFILWLPLHLPSPEAVDSTPASI